MDITIQHDKLTALIRRDRLISLESKQISARLLQLLPERLETIYRSLKSSAPSATVRRSALASDGYRSAIDEYIQIYSNGFEAKIQSETHMMLLMARESLREFRVAKIPEPIPPAVNIKQLDIS